MSGGLVIKELFGCPFPLDPGVFIDKNMHIFLEMQISLSIYKYREYKYVKYYT